MLTIVNAEFLCRDKANEALVNERLGIEQRVGLVGPQTRSRNLAKLRVQRGVATVGGGSIARTGGAQRDRQRFLGHASILALRLLFPGGAFRVSANPSVAT